MQSFFQSKEYFSLFNNCSACIPSKITYTHNGSSYYFIAIQHIQNRPNLPKNPVIIDGLSMSEYPMGIQIDLLSRIISKLKSHHFLPFTMLQIRNSSQLNKFSLHMKNWGFAFQNHTNFKLKTTTPDTCWKQLSINRKKQILKSFNNGAIIIEASQEESVFELYRILLGLYKHKVQKQIPPLSVFINFFNLLQSSHRSKIFLVKYQNKIVGGSVCPIDPLKQIYEWYICGLDSNYKNIHPSVLATWAPIKYASENKIPIFDFMGAGKPDVPYGVRDFKKKFGGQLINVGKFVYCK